MSTQSDNLLEYHGTADWLAGKLEAVGDVSFPDFVLQGMAPPEDGPVLIYLDKAYDAPAFRAAVTSVATQFVQEFGVESGDRIALCLDNSDTYVFAYLGAQLAGAITVPINPKLMPPEISHIDIDCTPRLYVTDSAHVDTAEEAIRIAGVSTTSVDVSDLKIDLPDAGVLPTIDVSKPASIFYTSGTTGKPKGVVHTHRTLVAGGLQCSRAWGYDSPGLTTLAVTPLFHIASHSWFLPVIANGGRLVVDRFKTHRTFELLAKHRVNGFGAVLAMLLMMMRDEGRGDFDLTSVTNVRFGASAIPTDSLKDLARLFPNAALLHGMGQTESGGTISVLPGEFAFTKAGGTGFPLAGCAVRIVDDNMVDVPVNGVGEIIAKGPNVMVGYYGQAEATASTIVDGWLRTGDLGYIDEDGCVYISDRKKDMIIRGGENIYSIEVENVLQTHPDVKQCAVVGKPDELLGETVWALVVTDASTGPDLTSQLTAHCASRVASFKVPIGILYVDSMPVTATGKIQKSKLRDLLISGDGETGP